MGSLINPVNINGHSLGRTVWHFVSKSLKMLSIDSFFLTLYFYTHEIIKESYKNTYTNMFFPAFFIITEDRGMVNCGTHML